jgi:hypothetical protein
MTRNAKSPRKGPSRRRPRKAAQVNKIPVFISWSGEKSNKVAHQLEEWLELVMQMVKPWMSESDIDAGENWHQELEEALETAEFAIVCLTKNNLKSTAIHYEVGFLLGGKKIKICPYLLDLQISDIKWPLDGRQAMLANEQGTRKLLAAINNSLGGGVSESVLNKSFKTFWPELEAALNEIRAEVEEKPASERVTSRSLEEDAEQLMQVRQTWHRKEEELPRPKPKAANKSSKASKKTRPKPSQGVTKRGARAFTLEVVNPSSYARKGQVAVPWELIYRATKIAPQNLIVFDDFDNPLPTQVEIDDQNDPLGGTLLFTLRDVVPSRVENDPTPPYLVHAEIGASLDEVASESPRIELETKGKEERRVRLINSRLEVRLELFPRPWEDDRDWYAGAASSVLHKGKEILSAFAEVDPFNYEKRCMQVADLWLVSPTERLISGDHAIIRQPYQLISQFSGPVRASIKIASAAFDCGYDDPDTRKQIPLKCRLYREISLYQGGNYVVERLYVQETAATAKSGKDSVNHPFKARYFTYADFGVDLNKYNHNPEWLVMNSDWPPSPGYGFAANGHIRTFENPVPNFRYVERQHKTFSWALSPDTTHECLHLFMHGKFNDLRARVDRAWYEILKDPLRVKVRD